MKLAKASIKVKFCFNNTCPMRKPQSGCANADETCTKKGCPLRKKTPLLTLSR